MMSDPIDIVFRTVAVMAALLLAALLLTSGRAKPASVPGALFCFAVAAFFVTSLPGGGAALGPWGYVLTGLCVTKAAWFWLFARTLFADRETVQPRQLLIVAGVAIAGTWQQIVFLPLFRNGDAGTLDKIAGFGFEFVLGGFVLLGLFEAARGMATDLVERRRQLRVGFMVVTGVYLGLTLAVQTRNLLLGISTPEIAARANMLLVAASCLAAAWFLLQPRRDSWLEPARTDIAVALNRAETAVLSRLKVLLMDDRIFLQEGLTIGDLAVRLQTGEHVLRQVINRGMGYRNFNDFLHDWRIREACEELVRPEQVRLPILTIAMNVGYGSIGAFNRAFKARTGMTPSAYRRSAGDRTHYAA